MFFRLHRALSPRQLITLSVSGFALVSSAGAVFSGVRLAVPVPAPRKLVQAPLQNFAEIDRPFLFTYGTWEKRARIEAGKILLRGDGLTPKGGGGVNTSLDLSAATSHSPGLRIRVGAANTMKTLRVLLCDMAGQVGTWEYVLPTKESGLTLLTPKDGASLATPNALEKPNQALDLRHIMQWQLGGDYSGDGPVDVEIVGLPLVKPDANIQAQRDAKTKQEELARERKKQEQEAQQAKYRPGLPTSPVVESVSLVAPNILALTMQSGRVVPGSLTQYTPQPGDEKRTNNNRQVLLIRKGVEIGWLIGPKRDQLVTYERVEGDPLLEFLADLPATYSLSLRTADNKPVGNEIRPIAVYRKSKPTDWAQPGRGFAMRHIVYLKLSAPHPGMKYVIRFHGLNVQKPEAVLSENLAGERSEAIHVPQIGFRPDDPVKRAFLSVWLGTGGAYLYQEGLRFSLVESKSGRRVYSGRVELAKAADVPEHMATERNFNGTNVYRMNFGDFKTPGTYRVVVEGIGCSYPFPIEPETWETAFKTQMRGLYHQRSGVTLGPPYTSFQKPRDFFPGDGILVTQSTYNRLTKGGEAFDDLAKGDTHTPIPQAWGGYHDAGDWNPRRITHMKVTHAQLELLELFPNVFGKMRLSVPPTPGLPDLLTEALFELDCFRRLQKPDGGVPFGIETQGDPIDGEVSWLQSMPAYVFAPDIGSSIYYAGVAARVARLLAPYDPAKARVYRASALAAMNWTEARWPGRTQENPNFDRDHWEIRDDRNFAALQCFLLTKEKHWHDVFLQDTCLKADAPNLFAWGDHVQRDAAFAYARMPDALGDAAMKRKARAGLVAQAEQALTYADGNAFNLTTPDRGKPQFIGFYSTPDAIELARAHFLTGKTAYLAGAIAACQFSGGANPSNLVYTTGLGANPIRHPLHLDSRRTGQPAPPGLTTYGNIDLQKWHENFTTWPLTYFLNAICTPMPMDWPTAEAYFDVFLYVAQNEFTVDAWTPNIYVWGYLAARPSLAPSAGMRR